MISLNIKFKKNITALSGLLFLITVNQAAAASCRVAATKCEVADMIQEAKLSPQPDNALPATNAVQLSAFAIANLTPQSNSAGPQNFKGNIAVTLRYNNSTSNTIDISCLSTNTNQFIKYYGYSGNTKNNATNVTLTVTPATTPEVIPTITGSSLAVGIGSLTAVTTVNVTGFAPNNLWEVSALGQLVCTITPTDAAYLPQTVIVPVPYSS